MVGRNNTPDEIYYTKSHHGMYKLLRNCGYNVDYTSATRPETFENYKALYFPYYSMLDEKIVPYLENFLENGGTIIAHGADAVIDGSRMTVKAGEIGYAVIR